MNFCPAEHVPPAERHNFMMISGRKSVTKRAYRRPPELSLSVPFSKFRDESNRNDEKARNGQKDAKNGKKRNLLETSEIFENSEIVFSVFFLGISLFS